MSVYCKNCTNAVKSNLPSGELFCKVFPFPCDEILGCSREPKVQTNADHIRAMSDEELAEFLTEYRCVQKAPHCMEADCTQCWLDWLKQEAEE